MTSSCLVPVGDAPDPLPPVPVSEQGSLPEFGRSPGLPPTVTKADFLEATEVVTKRLSSRFAHLFGGADDFAQEVILWSLEAVKSFDPSRGALAGLLYRAARNKCLNKIRDTLTRADPPCAKCHSGSPCGSDGGRCPRYKAWVERNRNKANIHRPLSASAHPALVETRVSPAPSAEDATTAQDLSLLIDQELPAELRADYLRMRDTDVAVPLHRRQKVQRAVADILTAAGVDAPDCESGRSKPATLLQDDVDGEQERGGDERPAPLGTESILSNTIPESVADQSGLSLVA
jgi:DNA-directed RNA polymerase specialized sigma24 family protein